MTFDTLNPIELRIVDPEGHQLAVIDAWRVPAVGDTLRLVMDDDGGIAGEVTHRTWWSHPAIVPSSWVVVEIEPL